MAWWAWIIVGLVLMGIEMLAVDAAFYLVFIGAAALLLGLVGLAGLALPVWVQWVAFAVLAFVFMVFFRERLYNKLRGGALGFRDPAVGKLVTVEKEVLPGAETRVKMRGSRWTAVNIGDQTIADGSQARITEVDGLNLMITGSEANSNNVQSSKEH